MYTKITISGQICSGKTTLFWDLYKTLNWPTFSASHFFRDYARMHHVSLQKGEEQEDSLVKVIDYGMKELLKKEDHVIIEGWMAGVMADEIPKVLRILLKCNEDERIKRFIKRDGGTVEEARRKIKEREANVYMRLKQIYHREDILKPKNYNMVIDTSKKSQTEVLRSVLAKLQTS